MPSVAAGCQLVDPSATSVTPRRHPADPRSDPGHCDATRRPNETVANNAGCANGDMCEYVGQSRALVPFN